MRSRAAWTVAAIVACAAIVVIVGRLTRPADGSSLHGKINTAASQAPTATPRAVGGPSTSTTQGSDVAGADTTTLHYISNTGSDLHAVTGLGFNLFDIGPDKSRIDALRPGQQALVWLGNLDNTNCTPGYSWSEFQSAVRRLAHDPKVFGYFLSDEPHPSICPNAVRDLRQRADFIRAQDPRQKSFIVVMDAARICGSAMGCEYRALNETLTHVDFIGIDPFPCRVGGGCDPLKIDLEVQRAVAGGISLKTIVPVFQVFGQACSPHEAKYYQQLTASELTAMLNEWQELVPHPAFDSSYTWRSQGPACPSLDHATSGGPSLQSVMKAHNGG